MKENGKPIHSSPKDHKKTPAQQPPAKHTPLTQHEIDEEIDDSFPASDPPSWTSGAHRKHKEDKSDKKT